MMRELREISLLLTSGRLFCIVVKFIIQNKICNEKAKFAIYRTVITKVTYMDLKKFAIQRKCVSNGKVLSIRRKYQRESYKTAQYHNTNIELERALKP